MKHFSIFLLMCLSIGCVSQTKPNTLLWKVSKKGNKHTSYLFGTFHQVNPDFFDSLKVANKCLKHSKILFVEDHINPKDSAQYLLQIKKSWKQLVTWNKAKWDSTLTQDQRKIFERFVKSGFWKDKYYQLSPVAMIFPLINIYFQYICDTVNRTSYELMDQRITDIGIKGHLKIIGLDSNQIDILNNAGKKDKDLDIENSVKTDILYMKNIVDKNPEMGASEFLYHYRKFDLDYSLDKTTDGKATLLKERNDKWMKILSRAFTDNDCFVAVGMQHLFYMDGLIQQLRRTGFTVSPVSLQQ
ncbi:TraB/GumN family protein [Compostibacter hankyongensis]|uniref:TraB/GumN family protein n=1 Tax=Compostibacter hankyongensis TaxID=1007089 RepID=A0ABP8G1D5_9BACT